MSHIRIFELSYEKSEVDWNMFPVALNVGDRFPLALNAAYIHYQTIKCKFVAASVWYFEKYCIFPHISQKILGSFLPSKSGVDLYAGHLPPAVYVVVSQVSCVNSGRPVGGAWSAVVCET